MNLESPIGTLLDEAMKITDIQRKILKQLENYQTIQSLQEAFDLTEPITRAHLSKLLDLNYIACRTSFVKCSQMTSEFPHKYCAYAYDDAEFFITLNGLRYLDND